MLTGMDTQREPVDIEAYERRVRSGPCLVAPLPPGIPYRRQQFHALMFENGVLPWAPGDAAELAGRIRSALDG